MRRSALATLVATMIAAATPAPAAEAAAWRALAVGDAVVLVRHATAPGNGDPPGFRLDDCATQRNLSADGRAEARRIEAAMRLRRIPVARVLSSRWCRCLETARLAFGAADPDPTLDSLFPAREETRSRTESLRTLIAGWRGEGGNLVLVTHHANILALTGIAVGAGELLVLRRGADLAVVGRIPVTGLPAL